MDEGGGGTSQGGGVQAAPKAKGQNTWNSALHSNLHYGLPSNLHACVGLPAAVFPPSPLHRAMWVIIVAWALVGLALFGGAIGAVER